MVDLKNKVQFSILILLAIFPFGFGFIAATQNFIHYKNFSILLIEIMIILVSSFFIFIYREKKPSTFLLITILFIGSIALRAIIMLLLETQPSSDFQWAVINASKFMDEDFKNNYNVISPHWATYSIFVSELFKITGSSLIAIKILNLVLSGITCIGIFFLTKESSKSWPLGFVSSLFYILFPADLLYKNLPTGDHLFTAIIPFVVILLSIGINNTLHRRYFSFLCFFFSGFLIGFIDLFKPIGLIILISSGITLVIFNNSKNISRSKNFLTALLVFTIIIFGYYIPKNIGFSILSQKTTLSPFVGVYAKTIRIGMDINHGGFWHQETAEHVEEVYYSNGKNDLLTSKILLSETKEIISLNRQHLFDFFKDKFSYVWQSDYDFYHWAIKDQNSVFSQFIDNNKFTLVVIDSYLLICLFFSTIGSLYCFFLSKNVVTISTGFFLVGFSILLLFTEVQQRYRGVLVSCIPIYCSYGVYTIYRIFYLIRHKLAAMRNQ